MLDLLGFPHLLHFFLFLSQHIPDHLLLSLSKRQMLRYVPSYWIFANTPNMKLTLKQMLKGYFVKPAKAVLKAKKSMVKVAEI